MAAWRTTRAPRKERDADAMRENMTPMYMVFYASNYKITRGGLRIVAAKNGIHKRGSSNGLIRLLLDNDSLDHYHVTGYVQPSIDEEDSQMLYLPTPTTKPSLLL